MSQKQVRIVQEGRFIKAYCNETGKDVTKSIPQPVRQQNRNSVITWDFDSQSQSGQATATESINLAVTKQAPVEMSEVQSLIRSTKRPKEFVISDLKWRYLVRAVARGKNIMMTGPTGTGKTKVAKIVASMLNRPFYYFNMGATQDPRSTLIGTTHFKKDSGTYFSQSMFVSAIQTENAVILLDELTRINDDGSNILMPVLDETQRYLRLDEHPDSPTVPVAKGVCIIATANIGTEYVATRTLDRALRDRFVEVEMEYMTASQESKYLMSVTPGLNQSIADAIADIANSTRKELTNSNPKIQTAISTRMTVEAAGLAIDGFSLTEIAEVAFFPMYDPSGGVNSERTFIKQLVQKHQDVIKTPEVEVTPAAVNAPF
jgi:MoxR-like ATPase